MFVMNAIQKRSYPGILIVSEYLKNTQRILKVYSIPAVALGPVLSLGLPRVCFRQMPHVQQHRGAHPEDHELFSAEAVVALREAVRDCVYLLDRGYGQDSVLDVVGRRYSLRARQRLALQRVICSSGQRLRRERFRRELVDVRGQPVEIDGFNLIIGLEVALSGGVLLRCCDGSLRDLAGLRGTYRMVTETEAALSIVGQVLGDIQPSALRILLDRPVSNSGRLKARILERGAAWPFSIEVELVADPDRELVGRDRVVSSDSAVLDSAAGWVNLLGFIVEHCVRTAWIVDLSGCSWSTPAETDGNAK